jgi:hypothetical protein
VGVCERCDSMGVKERRERTAVNSRPFDYAQGKQFKVERAKIVRAKRPDPVGVNADTPNGSG